MNEENKAVVLRFIHDVLQDLNAGAIDDLVAPDFVSHTWGMKEDAPQALKQVTERMKASLSEIEFAVEDVIAEGDRVAVRVTSSATQSGEFHGMPASGKRYSIGEIHIFRVSEGKIVEHWHQYDLPSLMKQLGGDEQS